MCCLVAACRLSPTHLDLPLGWDIDGENGLEIGYPVGQVKFFAYIFPVDTDSPLGEMHYLCYFLVLLPSLTRLATWISTGVSRLSPAGNFSALAERPPCILQSNFDAKVYKLE